MRPSAAAWLLALAFAAAGCATYEDDLARAQHAYDASEHEHALAIFRVLEPDLARISPADRARYAYLRGMTDHQMGYKTDARHWLAVAAAIEQATPSSLQADWVKRMDAAMNVLNDEVYTAGVAALSNAPSPAPSADGKAKGEAEPPSNTEAPPAKPPKLDDW